jgi:adenylate cyclase
MKAKKLLESWGVAAGAAVAAAAGLALFDLPAGLRIIHLSYDLLFTLRAPVQPAEVLMVYMDDDSHERLGQRYDAPWDRRLHARLVDRLTAAGARAVVFDIVFSDPHRDPAVDEDFARALLANGSVVLAADTVRAGYGLSLAEMKRVIPPTDVLRDTAARIGSAGIKPSEDLVLRRHFHGSGEDLLPSLSWAAAALMGAKVTQQEAERGRERWVNYYGPPGSFPMVSYHLALDTNATSDALFRNRVIFIGARLLTKFAGERKDEFRSPYAHRSADQTFVPGVDLQATMFLNLIRGDWLRRWPAATERTVLVIFGLVIGATLALLRPGTAAVAALGVLLFIGAATYLGFTRRQFWFPWLIPAALTAVALAWAVVFNSIRLFIQKRLLEQSLALHLSPSRARQLMSRPELLRPGAEKQELSILFSDIADFTKISEGMDSDDLAQMMNRYFESAISAVHESDGTVVKLIGDAIFAIWNAPLPQADHGVRMCRAALKLRDQPVRFEAGGKERVLFTRIGLHTGEANVGNFGSATRFDYTALGENINLASRMEGLNKHLGTQVLMTGAAHALVAAQFVTRPVGSFQLKGFERPVEVYELLGPLEQAPASREWREVFAQALKCYRDLDHTTAKMLFHQVLHLRPEDGPSKFYLGRIVEIESEKMAAEWGGHTRMFDK